MAENANGGTDHADVCSRRKSEARAVRKKSPSLTELDKGDLKFNTEFRSVYASVLEQWLRAPRQQTLRRRAIL